MEIDPQEEVIYRLNSCRTAWSRYKKT